MAEPNIKKKARPVAGITQHPEKRRCGMKEPCKKMLRESDFGLGTPQLEWRLDRQNCCILGQGNGRKFAFRELLCL